MRLYTGQCVVPFIMMTEGDDSLTLDLKPDIHQLLLFSAVAMVWLRVFQMASQCLG